MAAGAWPDRLGASRHPFTLSHRKRRSCRWRYGYVQVGPESEASYDDSVPVILQPKEGMPAAIPLIAPPQLGKE